MTKITRAAFIEAVETGIRAADRRDREQAMYIDGKQLKLTNREKLTLRAVAHGASRFATTTYQAEMPDGSLCGCPITQAGLYPDGSDSRPVGNFATGFDCAIAAALGGWDEVPRHNIVEVEG